MAKYCGLEKHEGSATVSQRDRPTEKDKAKMPGFGIFRNCLSLCRNNDGFTLIEMLVATTVLALGLLGVIGMQLYAITGSSNSWDLTMAQNIAQQKIDYLNNETYNQCKATFFNNADMIGDYASAVSAGVITANDEITPGGDYACPVNGDYNTPCPSGTSGNDDTYNEYLIDTEPYGGLMRAVNNVPYVDDGTGHLAAPYTHFRRVTIQKVIDGNYAKDASNMVPPDTTIVIKVIVYWKDSGGHEHEVSEMAIKGNEQG